MLLIAEYWAEVTPLNHFLTNHLLPLAVLWGVAWLLAQRRQLQEELERHEHELDEQVKVRTAALAAREEQLAKIFRANPGGIAITRRSDGCFLEANDAYFAIVGYNREELIGHTILELGILSGESRAEVTDALSEQGHLHGRELRLTNARGEAVEIIFSSEEIEYAGEPCYLGLMVDITEHRQLEETTYRLAAIVDSSSDAIVSTDLQGRVVGWNHSAEQMYGCSASEAIGRPINELLPTRPDADEAAIVARVRKGDTVLFSDLGWTKADGTSVDLSIVLSPIRDKLGAVIGLAAVAHDITERKQLENTLAASERKYRHVYDNSPDMYMSGYPADRVIRDCNQTLARTLGYTREEMIGQPIRMLYTPAAYNRLVAVTPEYLAAGEYANLEVQLVAKDGTILDALLSGQLDPATADRPAYSRVTLRNITERKRAEAALREAYQRLQLAVDAAAIGVWNWNFADGSLEWDERMCELYGVPPEQRQVGLYYELWRERVHPDDRDRAEPSHGDPIYSRSRWSTTFRIILPGGDIRYIQVNAVKEFDADGQPLRMIGVNRDVSDQMRYELLLQDTNAALEQRVAERTADLQAALAEVQAANRLKDEFMAMISHELRTPITGVLTLSELLEEQIAGPLNNRQAAYVQGIAQSGAQLLYVVNGILNYVHLLSGKVQLKAEPCGLGQLLAASATTAQAKAAAKGQAVAVTVDPPGLTIDADATALAEILNRLLDNAVKYTPTGGRIGLEAHPSAAPDHAPGAVDLVVWDTGTGISAERIEHIFKPFVQADGSLARSQEGMGLGLAYVDKMVRLMRGTLRVESTPGEGSRFTITLPG